MTYPYEKTCPYCHGQNTETINLGPDGIHHYCHTCDRPLGESYDTLSLSARRALLTQWRERQYQWLEGYMAYCQDFGVKPHPWLVARFRELADE